jgi:hypothetical protein
MAHEGVLDIEKIGFGRFLATAYFFLVHEHR